MSRVELKLFCLVDIVGSTAHMHNGSGQAEHAKQIANDTERFKSMLESHDGTYENFTGDGHLGSFLNPQQAWVFAQAYCRAQSGSSYKSRIILTSGAASYSEGNLVSDDVNLAARLSSYGVSGNIILSQSAYDIIRKLDKNIESIALRTDEEVRDYGNIAYFLIEIDKIAINPLLSTDRLKLLLKNTKVHSVNILDGDFSDSSVLIWPVVPRASLNLIHIGQISLIKFLCTNLGWKLKILIADLMDDSVEIKDNYVKKLNTYFRINEISPGEVLFLSELMGENTASCCKITKGTFNSYLKLITFEQMERFIGKDYNTQDYKAKSVWKTLRPFFTLAASAYLSASLDKKCIILAGCDEHDMWNACTSHPSYEKGLGAILIPILKKNDNSQFSHEDQTFYWRSAEAIKNAMHDSNIAEWGNSLILALHNHSTAVNDVVDNANVQKIADTILERLNVQHQA